jgi:hypothetical protein
MGQSEEIQNFLGIIAILIILLSINHTSAEDFKKDAEKMIDETAALYMDNTKIPGLAIAISVPDGKTAPGKAGAISEFKSQFYYFKNINIFLAITANLDMMSPVVGEKPKGIKMADCLLLMPLQLFEIVK